MEFIDQITITLRSKNNETHDVYLDVLDNSLSVKWLSALNHLVDSNYHLEKNYHWMGFADRDLPLICDKINASLHAIQLFNWESVGLTPYSITEHFTIDNTLTHGETGYEKPGDRVVHDMFNTLHRYFEEFQGQADAISPYYERATKEIRWHIRQLNLLCHEFESRALSYRKEQYAPEWAQYNQLFCFLNTPTFNLDPETDFSAFGMDTLTRIQGDVMMGINKSVGKSHWEVFCDEGDVELDELTTSALISQWQGSGDFDISWSQSSQGHPWQQDQINKFIDWLTKRGFNPEDPSLTLGHPRVATVNLVKSFKSTDYNVVQSIINKHLDVYKIKTGDAELTLDYCWNDADYHQQQINLLS
tara:strand:+ start:1583 stop:2662 length:1080 start_codon:yes stop_codon:yes gene_type:complete